MDFTKGPTRWGLKLFVAIGLMLLPVASGAESPDTVKGLEEKLERIEKKQAELYHSLSEKKAAGLTKFISEHVTLGGLVEVEASRDENEKTGDASDIVLATVGLTLDAAINEKFDAHVGLLWEEDATDPIDMDEGTLTYRPTDALTLTAGKTYIPFGVFNSHFVSDPVVLELGETNETVLMASYSYGPVEASAGFFNGAVNDTGDDEIQDHFVSLAVEPCKGVTLGAYYTSNIGDSDYMTTLLTSPLTETVPGIGGSISLEYKQFSLDAEYIRAKRRYEVADLDANGDLAGDRPSAYNVEIGVGLNESMELAAKLEGNEDLFDHPERQYGAVFSYGLFENVTAKVEVLKGKYSDDTDRTLLTGQVGVEF